MRRVALFVIPIIALAACVLREHEPSIVRGMTRGSAAVAAPRNVTSNTGVTVIDLGTLDGAWSEARHINNDGQVIGGSTNAFDEPTGFLSANGVMTALAMGAGAINGTGTVAGGRRILAGGNASIWENGKITDLGTLGGTWSYALRINEAGQVGGWSENSAGREHAFFWENGVMTDLGTLGGRITRFGDMNEAGQLVGGSWTSSEQYHGFLWSHGGMTDLGTLGGPNSFAAAINDAGQVVGWSATGVETPANVGRVHAFLWTNGVMTDLGTLGGFSSRATDINETGQVIGYSTTHGEREVRAFLWENGVMTDLGTLGGLDSWAADLNDAGQVVGWSTTATGEDHAFMWAVGTMTDLGTLGGSSSRASEINAAGQVVGWSTTTDNPGSERAVLWLPPAANTAPTVRTGPDQRANAGQPVAVSFTFTEATPNGPWIWEATWGDGATSAGTATSTGEPITASHTYAAPGRYTARVAVLDAAGAAGMDDVLVMIGEPRARNRAPVVTASQDREAWTGEEVFVSARFDDQATPNGPWKWEINWGDGVKSQGTTASLASAVSGSHIYVAAGQFVARVTVTDRAGAAGSDTVAFTITANTAPIVDAEVAQLAEIGQPVDAPFSFTDATPTNSGSLHIDWGDGTTATDILVGSNEPIRPFHTYAAAGRYSVIITVTDQLGAAGRDTLVMRVGPTQWVEVMIQEVHDLVTAGSLTQGRADGLLGKLRKTFAALENGRTRPAIKELEGFIKQGDAFVKRGVLAPEQGQALIAAAQGTIGQLK
jgi:probable HAF family extracellular repeat protein